MGRTSGCLPRVARSPRNVRSCREFGLRFAKLRQGPRVLGWLLGRSAIRFILVLFQLPELVWVDEAVLGDLDAFHDRDSRGES